MKIKELVSHIAKFEGKKHEASVSDIREIIGILSDVVYAEKVEFSQIFKNIYMNGFKRSKKKGKKNE